MFVGEWRPGVLERVMFSAGVEGHERMRTALTLLAHAAEKRTKTALALNTHPYDTPTTASPGGPPALVSGTLRRSITHERVAAYLGGWATKVGTGAGFYPPYGGRSRTPSSLYGLYQETGLRNGATYPFLAKNVRDAVLIDGPGIWRTAMRGPW